MELGRVKDYAAQRRQLEEEIAAYEAGETGHENVAAYKRFEDIWETLDILAGAALDRSSISADDGEGTSVTITRKAETVPGEHHSGLLHYANSQRAIEVHWTSDGQEFPLESITDKDALGFSDVDEVKLKLAIIEESIVSLEKMLSDNPSADTGLMFVDSVRS